MALAADEHRVVLTRHRDGRAYGVEPVHDDVPPAHVLQLHGLVPRVGVDQVHVLQEREERLLLDRFQLVDAIAETRDDVVEDLVRILRPGVVVGDEDDVGVLVRHPAHLGALRRVPVAAAAEDGDDVVRAGFANGFDGPLQSLGRLRVVDDDREGLALVHELHAPGRGLHRLDALGDDVQGNLHRDPGGDGGGYVGNVHLADQARDGVEGSHRGSNRHRGLEQGEVRALDEDVRLVGFILLRGVGHYGHGGRRLGEIRRVVKRFLAILGSGDVEVDDRALPLRVGQPPEQLRRGVPARRRVPFMVVPAQVGKHGDVKVAAVHPPLRQVPGANLHRGGPRAVVQHARHELLALESVRGGGGHVVLAAVGREPSGSRRRSILRGILLLGLPHSAVRREPDVVERVPRGPDDAAPHVVRVQDGTHHVRHRRLAARAGNADGGQRRGRVTVESRRQTGQRRPRAGHHHLRDVDAEAVDGPLANDRHRARRDGVEREIVAVHLLADDADEYVAAEYHPRIVGDAAHLHVLVLAELDPLRDVHGAVLEQLAEQRHALLHLVPVRLVLLHRPLLLLLTRARVAVVVVVEFVSVAEPRDGHVVVIVVVVVVEFDRAVHIQRAQLVLVRDVVEVVIRHFHRPAQEVVVDEVVLGATVGLGPHRGNGTRGTAADAEPEAPAERATAPDRANGPRRRPRRG